MIRLLNAQVCDLGWTSEIAYREISLPVFSADASGAVFFGDAPQMD
jgi:hypothetical protein